MADALSPSVSDSHSSVSSAEPIDTRPPGRPEVQRKWDGAITRITKFNAWVRASDRISDKICIPNELRSEIEDRARLESLQFGHRKIGKNDRRKSQAHALHESEVQDYRALLAKSVIDPEIRETFKKDSARRTVDESDRLFAWCMKLKCFNKWPRRVQEELVRFGQYETLTAGRLIMREGDIPCYFYIVLSGEVSVFKTEKDPRTSKAFSYVINTLGAGDAFGELALMQNTKRNASIMTKRYTELLMVTKEDFARVIAETTEKEILKKVDSFKHVPLFKTFPVDARRIAEACRVEEYAPNQTIVYEGDSTDSIHFLLKGSARVLKLVNFTLTTHHVGRTSLARYNPAVPLAANESLVTKLLVIAIVKPGHFFGEGSVSHVQNKREAASAVYAAKTFKRGASVVAEEKSEVLSLSRGDFLKFASDQTFASFRAEYAANVSLNEMIDRYMHARRRAAFKKGVVEEIVRRKKEKVREVVGRY